MADGDWDPFADPAEEACTEAVLEGPVRVLCLHGTCSNGRVMKFQLQRVAKCLGARAELIFVDGPTQTSTDTPLYAEQQKLFGKAFGPCFFDFHPWLQPGKGFQVGMEPDASGLDDVITYLQELFHRHSPIHGVLGFSEGANAASLLVGEIMAKGDAADLRFVVHLNPGRPDWVKQRPELFRHKLMLRSLHSSALNDDQVPQQCALRDLYEHPVCMTHEGGHQPLPGTSVAEAQRVAEGIAEFIVGAAPFCENSST